MKSRLLSCPWLLSAGLSFGALTNLGAATVTVDPGTLTSGFMNVFNLPGSGTYPANSPGAYQFGGSWGLGDLNSSISGSGPTTVVTLSPNTIGDPAAYWYTPSGGPGAIGNKLMDANLYNETTGTYVGTTLQFMGNVTVNSLLSSMNQQGNGWTSVAFIKDFAPDYSSFNMITAPLTSLGVFSISLATVNDPGRHVQYGFETIGPDVWATDVAGYGVIQITTYPSRTLRRCSSAESPASDFANETRCVGKTV